MAHPDLPSRRRSKGGGSPVGGSVYLAVVEAMKRRNRGSDRELDEGGVPVEPDHPRNLSGGAAAELDFEQD